jgi:multiple sugar transport system ATP-binding protein
MYQDSVVAVHGVDLDVADGEFVVLVGPSGCGKSTTLRMIAGLESITAGKLFIGDRMMNDVPPKNRDIAMVFQGYALYPHMTVRDNLAFALKLRHSPKTEIEQLRLSPFPGWASRLHLPSISRSLSSIGRAVTG